MTEQKDVLLSPTVTKVLDEYLEVLRADEEVSNEAAGQLNALLRKGKIPKNDEIDIALSPPRKKDKS